MTPRSRRIELDDAPALHVLEWPALGDLPPGSADRWLLVHGLASNAWLWSGVGDLLADAGAHVVAVDQRGHGRSDRPQPAGRAAFTTPVAADDLARVLDHLGWDRARIAGQSWGGNVVVELADRHPDRIIDLAAVDGGTIELASRFPVWEDCETALRPPPLAGRPRRVIEQWLAETAADWPEAGRRATLENFATAEDGTITPRLRLEDHLDVLHGLWSHEPWPVIERAAVDMRFLMASPTEAADDRHHLEQRLTAAAGSSGRRRTVHWFLDGHHDLHAQQPGAVVSALTEAT